MEKKTSFIMGVVLLTTINFIVRSMGFIYRILLSRMIGPQAIGLYQMVFPFLMVLITIPTAGIPIAVSKLVAKENSLKNRRGMFQILLLALSIGGILSLILTLFVSFKIDFITERVLKNNDLYLLILWIIPAISLITFSSILRGFFYGIKDIKPAALAQIIEQLSRITFVLAVLYMKKPDHPITMATIAIIGLSIGELFGLICLILSFGVRRIFKIIPYNRVLSSNIKQLKDILYISVPITISRLLSVFMQTINAILIPHRLIISGYSQVAAVELFGKISGMAMPLLFLPFTVTSALVINIIPNISEQMAVKNIKDIETKGNQAIRITLLVAIPTTLIFTIMGKELASLVFHQRDVGLYLSLISYSTLFLCMQHTLSGILHGLGKQVITTINFLLGMTIQLYCTYYLVPNPRYGIYGFIIGFTLSSFVIFTLNLISLRRYMPIRLSIVNTLIKPITAALMAVGTMFYLYYHPILSFSPNLYSAMVFIFGGFLYLAILVMTKAVDARSIIKNIK
ncbi:putative polysaccharide biosynthesis protein [Alkaliphilus serpentinus]|uniref:Polysaccharide biosynthesis protein n=1 Tax=Alkaliphilus serpentinus TaxID=1482731 RepID=A0A833MDJ2_9FIRM|nr:polysaccharide biosynthesis protein [Alkaliphilus serpentinus]KAB3529045.1 polysaccharide biosynthesis protein [Alkaliphilus serpentinus]